MTRVPSFAVLAAIGCFASIANATTVGRISPLQARIVPLRPVVLEQATRIEVTETRDEVTLAVPADVLFVFDSARVRAPGVQTIRLLARRVTTGPITVTGHTDSLGEASYNERLSLRRAHAVAGVLSAALTSRRVHIAVRGMGERRPVAPNDRAGGRRRNRRVEVRLPR